MKHLLFVLLALVSCVFARMPIDTIAWERSDSGAKYVKVHVPYIRDQTLYARFTPDSIPANTNVELIDSLKGWGTVRIPGLTTPSRYMLDFSGYSSATSTWVYTLKLDTVTLFTGTYTSAKVQIRELAVYADTAKQKLYVTRTTKNEAAAVTTVDSVAYTSFGQSHRVHWIINVNNPARILGLRGHIQQ